MRHGMKFPSMMAYPSFLDYCQFKTVAKKLNFNNIGVIHCFHSGKLSAIVFVLEGYIM